MLINYIMKSSVLKKFGLSPELPYVNISLYKLLNYLVILHLKF